MDLRGAFLWTACLALGLAIGSGPGQMQADSVFGLVAPSLNWHFALLAAASAGIVCGLIRQSLAVRRWLNDAEPLDRAVRHACRYEIAWRWFAAALLTLLLALQLAIARDFVQLPESEWFYGGDVLTTHVWWLLLLIILGEAHRRQRRPAAPRRGYAVVNVLAWCGVAALGLYVVVEKALISFLVHVACRGVDVTLKHTGNRYPLVSQADELRLLLTVSAAVAALLTGATLWALALVAPGSTRRWRRALFLAGGGLLLLAAAGINVWFYRVAYPALSPDLAGAGLAANRFDLLGGLFLAILLAAVAAALVAATAARNAGPHATTPTISIPPAGESLPALGLIVGAAADFLAETYRGSFNLSWDLLFDALLYPDVTITLAMLIMALSLVRRRMGGRSVPPLRPLPISLRRLAGTWLAAMTVLAIGVPTLAAFAFAFWLGPWYRW